MQIDMRILKLEVSLSEAVQAVEEFRKNRIKAFETITMEVKTAVSHAINQLLQAEMTLFLGKPDQGGNTKNGYKDKEYVLKGVGSVRLRVPQDRKNKFKSDIIPPREQMDPRLKEDVAVLHLAGISTRTLSMISKRILGVEISADTVSKSLQTVEEKALKWLERPLTEKYWALYIDGTNFRIQRRGSTEKEPSLVVLGIDSKNRRSILAIQPGQKDSADCWREVFKDLKKRGLQSSDIQIGIMDGLPGLESAFKDAFPNAVTGRCWVHSLRNAVAKAPARLADAFKLLAHKIMYASSESAAREAFNALKVALGTDAKSSVRCIEKDLDSLLAHYKFDKHLWSALKTTNPIERVNKELKRRTKTMETLGERTLEIVTAFTALRLEYHWSAMPVNAKALSNLKGIKYNQIESTLETLIH
jgi:putative transposase